MPFFSSLAISRRISSNYRTSSSCRFRAECFISPYPHFRSARCRATQRVDSTQTPSSKKRICSPSRTRNWLALKQSLASPIHKVEQKDGRWRICGNYQRLNARKKVLSSLDLHKAYHQIPVAPKDIPKTAVITPFGLIEYTCMTFCLRNAAQTFQRYINRALGDL